MSSPKQENGGKAIRFSVRLPRSTTERLKRASAIRGQSVAAFIRETVSREADQVLVNQHHWEMGAKTADAIRKLLANPPPINKAAKNAAKDFAAQVQVLS